MNRLGLSFLSLTHNYPESAGWSNRRAVADELKLVAGDYDLTLIDAGLLCCEANAATITSISQAILFLSKASATSRQVVSSAAADVLDMADGRRCAAVLTMASA